jgi:chitinase
MKSFPMDYFLGLRKHHVTSLLGIPVLFLAVCSFGARAGDPGRDFAVVAYLHGGSSDIDEYPVEQLSSINYSFLHLNGNRLAIRGSRDSVAILHLVSLKKRNPELKIILSVGGWGGCQPCSDVFSSPEGRHEFATSASELLQLFGADGVDLDWEFPAIEGYPGHRFAPEDKHNFTLLIQELRAEFGNRYQIDFAAGGFIAFLQNSVEWNQVMPLVDHVNLMTYDLVNGFSTVTGHHTPLYSCPGQLASTDYAVRYLDSVGVSRRKVVIGAAFYARVWEKVNGQNNGLFQEGKFQSYIRFRSLSAYFDSCGSFRKFWDSTAQAPYAYDATHHLFATFDNEQSVSLKTQYAIDQKLGGIMFWEITGDKHTDGLLDAITKTATSARR